MANRNKNITIAAAIDVVGALATESLTGQVWYMDTNKGGGSIGHGTENLKTAVKKGDILVWNVTFLECEAFAAIDKINIDKSICEPQKKYYEGTDVTYWEGEIKKNLTDIPTPYRIEFKLGIRDEPMETCSSLCLIGRE